MGPALWEVGTVGVSGGIVAGRWPDGQRRDSAKETERVDGAEQPVADARESPFRISDNVPEEACNWATQCPIEVSAMLTLSDKDDRVIFVGQ